MRTFYTNLAHPLISYPRKRICILNFLQHQIHQLERFRIFVNVYLKTKVKIYYYGIKRNFVALNIPFVTGPILIGLANC